MTADLTPAMYKILSLPANLALVAGSGSHDWRTGANMPDGYDLDCTGCIWHGIRRDSWADVRSFEDSIGAHIRIQHGAA